MFLSFSTFFDIFAFIQLVIFTQLAKVGVSGIVRFYSN